MRAHATPPPPASHADPLTTPTMGGAAVDEHVAMPPNPRSASRRRGGIGDGGFAANTDVPEGGNRPQSCLSASWRAPPPPPPPARLMRKARRPCVTVILGTALVRGPEREVTGMWARCVWAAKEQGLEPRGQAGKRLIQRGGGGGGAWGGGNSTVKKSGGISPPAKFSRRVTTSLRCRCRLLLWAPRAQRYINQSIDPEPTRNKRNHPEPTRK